MPTRRQIVTGIAVACCSPFLSIALPAESQQDAMKKIPNSAATRHRTSLHQEVEYSATPKRIYEVLLSSKYFAAFSGLPAEIDPNEGGAFSMFNKMILGRNVELVPDRRIVQAWRPVGDFPDGTYTLVEFQLAPKGSGTHLVLDHTGFPEGHYDHLYSGWYSHYWEPLRKFLG
jgi:activator of HSP90 ATPase